MTLQRSVSARRRAPARCSGWRKRAETFEPNQPDKRRDSDPSQAGQLDMGAVLPGSPPPRVMFTAPSARPGTTRGAETSPTAPRNCHNPPAQILICEAAEQGSATSQEATNLGNSWGDGASDVLPENGDSPLAMPLTFPSQRRAPGLGKHPRVHSTAPMGA